MAGTPTTIHYRWTAQDVSGAAATPARIENPYGINPDEVFVATGKPAPDDRRWAKQFADGDEVDLPTTKCRLPWMLAQFLVPGHVWEECPPGIDAATIGELCQKLGDRKGKYGIYADFGADAPAPKTPDEAQARAHRQNLLAKKLYWYWQNTDYRWALLHSGISLTTVDQKPETLATQAKAQAGGSEVAGTLRWVLARSEARQPIGVAPNPKVDGDQPKQGTGGGQGLGTDAKKSTARVEQAPNPHADPPAGSPYGDIPPDLRATLETSFADRLAGLPGAEVNLMYGFPAAPRPAPLTIWEALDNLSMMAVNLLVRLFARIHDIDPTHALWKQIRWIRNQWWGGSAGIKVVYRDPVQMRACLDGLLGSTNGHAVARDAYMGAMEHQIAPMKVLVADLLKNPGKASGPPPDCDTWREVWKLADESVHFCVDNEDLATVTILGKEYPSAGRRRRPGSDDIHIDWMSPVKGIDPATGKCDYDWGVSVTHWKQATEGKGAPVFTFSLIDGTLDDALAFTSTSARADTAAKLQDFATRWRAAEKRLAVDGKAGYDKSLEYCSEYVEIMKPVRAEWALYSSNKELMKAISDQNRVSPAAGPPP